MKVLFVWGFLLFSNVALAEEAEEADDAEVAEEEADEPQIIDGFSPEDVEAMANSNERFEFQAEVTRLMDIIINALYTNKDIFVRELISNSADALEKVRFNAIQDPDYLGDEKEMKITMKTDDEKKTIEFCDTGVGMTKQELIENLGTVAKSGTTNFLEALADKEDASNLIGQFGVGFYSAFLVADKLQFKSASADAPGQTHVWSSTADGMFSVYQVEGEQALNRGSCVKLFMKDDAHEFVQIGHLEKIAMRYSQFMQFPIFVPDDKAEDEDEDIEIDDDEDEDEDKDEEEKKPKTKEPKGPKWRQINNEKPIWLRSKDDITEDEYHGFYKAISKDVFEPLAYTHFSAEGDIEFSSILYIPKRAPPEMSMATIESWGSKIKMYVRRVLVAESLDQLLPRYLKWVQGVVDSDDLPLNVSREQLQQSKILRVISKKLTRKVLEMLKKLSKDEGKDEDDEEEEDDEDEAEEFSSEKTTYDKFYEEFKSFLLLGCLEDDSNRSKLAKLLRFPSTYTEANGGQHRRTSLEGYHKRMKEEQPAIYYMAGDAAAQMAAEPSMEIFKKRDLEVLFLTESNDEGCIGKVMDFEGVKLKSIQKAGDLLVNWNSEENQRFRDLGNMYRPLTKWWTTWAASQKAVKIGKVEVSRRLVSSPAVLVASEYGQSAKGERLQKGNANSAFMDSSKTLEINADHPVIHKMFKKIQADPDDPTLETIAAAVAQTATLQSGFDLESANAVIESVYKLISLKHGLDPKAVVTDVEIDIIEEPVEEAEDEDVDDIEIGSDEDDEAEKEPVDAAEKAEL